MKSFLHFCTILRLITSAFPFKTNITQFGNCVGALYADEVLPVEVYDIQYEKQDGLVNTVHGKYNVRTKDTREKELVITIYHCPEATDAQCKSNGKTFVESLHCDQFKQDDRGIWFMISNAMSGSHCGETTGTFDLNAVILRNEYLTKYITEEPVKGRYYLMMLFHKKLESIDDIHVRACVGMEFDVL